MLVYLGFHVQSNSSGHTRWNLGLKSHDKGWGCPESNLRLLMTRRVALVKFTPVKPRGVSMALARRSFIFLTAANLRGKIILFVTMQTMAFSSNPMRYYGVHSVFYQVPLRWHDAFMGLRGTLGVCTLGVPTAFVPRFHGTELTSSRRVRNKVSVI